jgi:hypothetical protein
MFDFTNAGEIWTCIGAIGSIFVIILALFPIFRDYIHGFKIKDVIRNKILFDLELIHESYFGKVLTNPQVFNNPNNIPYEIKESDFKYFSNLELLYDSTVPLTSYEKNILASIIHQFRKTTYRKIENKYYMDSWDVYLIELLSFDLCTFIFKKTKQGKRNVREQSYRRITHAGELVGKEYISYKEVSKLFEDIDVK